jgi:hypothetical protein
VTLPDDAVCAFTGLTLTVNAIVVITLNSKKREALFIFQILLILEVMGGIAFNWLRSPRINLAHDVNNEESQLERTIAGRYRSQHVWSEESG